MKLPSVFAGRRRLWLVRLVINGCLQALSAVLLSFFVSGAVNQLHRPSVGAGPSPTLGLTLAVVMVVATALLRWLERADTEKLSQHYVYRLRQRILRVLWGTGGAAVVRGGSGVLLLRFVGDMSAMGQWVGRGIARLITASLLFAGVLAGLAWREPRLALLAGLALLIFGALAMQLGPGVQHAVRRLRRRRAQLATELHTQVSSLGHAHVAEPEVQSSVQRAARACRRVRDAGIRVGVRTGFFEGLTEVLVLGAPLAALWLLSSPALQSTLTVGDLVGAMTLFGLLAAPLRDLTRVFEYAQRALIARAKIATFLDQGPALPRRALQRVHRNASDGK